LRKKGAMVVGLFGAAWWATQLSCSGAPTAPPVAPPEPEPAAPVDDPRPNVLIVVWDTVRADRMSLYGYSKPTTPKLEAFAREAAVFERATAPDMWTLPSHASMFTGLAGTEHGAKASWRWLDGRFDTLAELLGRAGYDTLAVSSNLIASPMTNLTQGFATVHTTFPRDEEKQGRYTRAARQHTTQKLLATDQSTEISPAFAGNDSEKWGKAAHKDAAPVISSALMDWLDERPNSGAPWFAYLNMMEAHTPRIPSMSARQRVMPEALIAAGLKTDASLYAENEYIVGKRDYTPEQLEAIGGVYDAALVDLDDATGALFDELERRGVLDDTVVIVVSDHGEALGEHRMMEHRWSVFQQLLSVPLVIRYPSKVPAGRIAERVSTTDVFATVLDVTGTQPQRPTPTSESLIRRVERKSFSQNIFTQMLDPFATQLKAMRKAYPDLDLSPWTRTYCAAFEGAHKLIHASDGQHMLFNVEADPAEANNLYASDPATAAKLGQALSAWEATLPTYDPALRGPADGAKGQKGTSESGMTREECEQLVMLGYVDDLASCMERGGEDTPDLARDRCGPTPTSPVKE